MNTTKNILTGFIFTFLISSMAVAQNDGFNDWDQNSDDQIDRNEYNSTFEDNDYYSDWDTDNNDRIDENEWNDGVDNTYRNYDENQQGTFDDWDRNNDGYIGNDEYSRNSFDTWDEDGNGSINNDEYATWNNNGSFDTNNSGNRGR